MADWYAIKFLESAGNIREVLKSSAGRKPSANVSRDIAACLQQGRLFFEAAALSPLQIRPLQLYYGFVSFAQGVVLARRMISASSLCRAHGLADVTPQNSRLEGLAVACNGQGTFQEFNDTMAPLGRISLFEDTMPTAIYKSFDSAASIDGSHILLKEIFSRLPSLTKRYLQTFESPANAMAVQFYRDWPGTTHRLRIDLPDLYENQAELVSAITQLRDSYSFLHKWRFLEAFHAWGRAVFFFDNVNRDQYDDLAENEITQSGGNAFTSSRSLMNATLSPSPIADMLPPLSGGYIGSAVTCAMQPLAGALLNEHSLQFLASFTLSSLVRYRPQTWQYAISRSFSAQNAADDRSLALIEEFLDQVLYEVPLMVARVIGL